MAPKQPFPKKKTRRSEDPESGLKKQYFSKIKQEYHDIDYSHKLSKEDQQWLSTFMNEDLGANLKESRERGTAINVQEAHVKGVWARNNARNADLYSKMRATGKLDNPDAIPGDRSYDVEDVLIEKIDLERALDLEDKVNNGDDSGN